MNPNFKKLSFWRALFAFVGWIVVAYIGWNYLPENLFWLNLGPIGVLAIDLVFILSRLFGKRG